MSSCGVEGLLYEHEIMRAVVYEKAQMQISQYGSSDDEIQKKIKTK